MATAPEILKKAAQHMEDRAAARDQAGGERSMARTVAAFNAITGHQVSERDGWLFMAVLKAARACTTPTGIADDYEDGAAYFGLAGEAAGRALVFGPDWTEVDKPEVFPPMPPQPANDNKRVVIIPGTNCEVVMPEGRMFAAMDYTGFVYAYSERPYKARSSNRWCSSGDCEQIGQIDQNPLPDWRITLIELPA